MPFKLHTRLDRIMCMEDENKPGVTFTVETKHPMPWWDYVMENADKISDAVDDYSGRSNAWRILVAMYEFDDDTIVKLAAQALEEATDDEARAGNPRFKLLSEVIGTVTGSS